MGVGVVKNLINKGGKALLKRLPKFAKNLLPTNQTGGTPPADGQYLNNVFIPDEDKVNQDALAGNLKRPAESPPSPLNCTIQLMLLLLRIITILMRQILSEIL